MEYKPTNDGAETQDLVNRLLALGAEVTFEYAMQTYDEQGRPFDDRLAWYDSEPGVDAHIDWYRQSCADRGVKPRKVRILVRYVITTRSVGVAERSE